MHDGSNYLLKMSIDCNFLPAPFQQVCKPCSHGRVTNLPTVFSTSLLSPPSLSANFLQGSVVDELVQ